MKRFIKDNLVLLIVLSVAVIISLALLVLVVIEHSRMYNYFQQAEELRNQIGELIQQKPAPVKGNIEPIKQETALYRENTAQLQQFFGKVKEPALEAFAQVLGVKLPEFLEKFRTAWEEDSNRTALGGRDRFYQRFKRDYPNWNQAVAAFQKEYQKVTAEPLSSSNVDEVLMTALGLQRNMENSPETCMRYMWSMRSRMVDLFAENKVDLQGEAASFGFDYKVAPLPEMVPDIVRNWQVIGDLATRIAKSGVSALYSFHIRNLASERVGDYVIYHYTFGVSGELNKIRAFVKALHEATRENRMYIVRSVFLYADSDGAQNVFRERAAEAERLRLELEGLNTGAENGAAMMPPDMAAPGMMPGMRNPMGPGMRNPMMPPDMMPGAEDPSQQQQPVKTLAQIREEIQKLPYDKRPGYGRKLFGGSLNCEAVFDVEYVALAEPELN